MINEIFLNCSYCYKKVNQIIESSYKPSSYLECKKCLISFYKKYRIWYHNDKITGYELWNETEKHFLYSYNMIDSSKSYVKILNSYNVIESIYEIDIFLPIEDKITDGLLSVNKSKIDLFRVFE